MEGLFVVIIVGKGLYYYVFARVLDSRVRGNDRGCLGIADNPPGVATESLGIVDEPLVIAKNRWSFRINLLSFRADPGLDPGEDPESISIRFHFNLYRLPDQGPINPHRENSRPQCFHIFESNVKIGTLPPCRTHFQYSKKSESRKKIWTH
jgi:hypothetical protein